jgi:sugar/nucleoside kinase (ribokinase family)
MRLVALGDLVADLVLPVRFPVDGGSYQQLPGHRIEPGGSFNVLFTAQRLGVEAIPVGLIGADVFGNATREILDAEGMITDGMMSPPGSTTTVVTVLYEPFARKHAYLWWAGKLADGSADGSGTDNPQMAITPRMQEIVRGADALFIQGYTLCEPYLRDLMQFGYTSGVPMWFDVGPATKDADPQDIIVARQNSYAIMTTEDELPTIADGESGEAAYTHILELGPRVLVIKRGSEGCRVITPTERFDVPAFPVTARDQVGAGDAFNAAFMVGVLRGFSLRDAAVYATATGAAKIRKEGTGRSMPTRAEVDAVLHEFNIVLEDRGE